MLFRSVEFWKSENPQLKEFVKELGTFIGNTNVFLDRKCFMLPVSAFAPDSKPLGSPVMTDLVLMDSASKISIVAKYADFKTDSDVISKWVKKSSASYSKDDVLTSLFGYIKASGASNLSGLSDELKDTIPYKLFSHLAAACYKSEKPVLIYQIFCDDKTKKSKSEIFNKLCSYVSTDRKSVV